MAVRRERAGGRGLLTAQRLAYVGKHEIGQPRVNEAAALSLDPTPRALDDRSPRTRASHVS